MTKDSDPNELPERLFVASLEHMDSLPQPLFVLMQDASSKAAEWRNERAEARSVLEDLIRSYGTCGPLEDCAICQRAKTLIEKLSHD